MTFPLNEIYGCSRLSDRLQSSAIIWQQLSLRSSAIIVVPGGFWVVPAGSGWVPRFTYTPTTEILKRKQNFKRSGIKDKIYKKRVSVSKL